jgi:hypothetical protein
MLLKPPFARSSVDIGLDWCEENAVAPFVMLYLERFDHPDGTTEMP